MMAQERDWSTIHVDVGYMIFNKLPEVVDRVWFGAVCKNWYYIAKDYNPLGHASRNTLPMLLVPVSECETERRLYSVSAEKVYPNVRLSNIPNKKSCGYSNGWLAFVEEDLSVILISPFKFRGVSVQLPILKTYAVEPYSETVSKLITSPDSTPENYTVVAIYSGMCHLAIIRTGDEDWTYILDYLPTRVIFGDIVFHRGLLYATDRNFKIVSVDINSHPPRIKILKEEDPFNEDEKWAANYIVESTLGDLYAVRRLAEDDYITRVFKVLKLEFDQESQELLRCNEVNTLSGNAFFVGESDSMSIEASNFGGCVPNSIYFIDDYWISDGRSDNDFEDSGIYSVEDKSVVRHYVRDPSHRFKPPAIWVKPIHN